MITDKMFKNRKGSLPHINNDVRTLVLHELIVCATIDDNTRFEKILDSNIDLLKPYSMLKEYVYEDKELIDSSSYFPTFIDAALYSFNDHYANKIVQKALSSQREDFIKSMHAPNGIFKENILVYLVKNCLERNLQNTLTTLVNEDVIKEDLIYRIIFMDHYKALRNYAQNLLQHEPNVAHILKQVCDNPWPKLHSINIDENFSALLDDVYVSPHIPKEDFKQFFIPSLLKNGVSLPHESCKKIFLKGVKFSFWNIDCVYSRELFCVDGAAFESTLVTKLASKFYVTDQDKVNAMQQRAELLAQNLEHAHPLEKTAKRMKI